MAVSNKNQMENTEKKTRRVKKMDIPVVDSEVQHEIQVAKKINTEKANNEDLSVEYKLINLYRFQLVLSEIDKIRTFRGELPFEVQDLEDEISGLRIRIENFQNSLLDFEKKISQEKIKITNANALVAKYTEQINNVRNNREYDSLSKEIENQELDLQLAEKRIREFTEEMKLLEEEIQKNKQILEGRQADLNSKREELSEIVSETKVQEEQLREEAKQIEIDIDTRLLISFKRIRKNTKNGLAIVCIQRDACGGCFNKIPPQRQTEIKLRKKIIVCEHCGRIIMDPGLVEPK